MEKYYLIQIKRTNGAFEKGVVVKDSEDAAYQSYHAYLGAYAYGNQANTDYVCAALLNFDGITMERCVWNNIPPEPEPTELEG